MKDIEVNSDRFTAVGVCLLLAIVLFDLLSNLYQVFRYGFSFKAAPGAWTYVAAAFFTVLAISFYRDRDVRRDYPYGLAAGLMIVAVLWISAATHWAGAAVNPRVIAAVLAVLDIMGSLFILVEGIHFFKRRVRVSQ
jgi:hypothetical protein